MDLWYLLPFRYWLCMMYFRQNSQEQQDPDHREQLSPSG
jgi:hypothetical protein